MADDELRRLIAAGLDPPEVSEFLAVAAGSVCIVVRDEGGKVVARGPVSAFPPRAVEHVREPGSYEPGGQR